MHGTAFHWRVILDDVALKNVRSTGAADGAGESNILQIHNRDLMLIVGVIKGFAYST